MPHDDHFEKAHAHDEMRRNIVVVPVARIDRATVRALNFANSITGDKQAVFVALTDISANEEFTAQNIKLEEWPKNIVPAGALTKIEDVEGKRSRALMALTREYWAVYEGYRMLGQPEKAVYEQLALEILRKLGEARDVGITEMNLGVQAYADGRWTNAVDWYERAQRDSANAGDRQTVALAGANLGEVLVSLGRLDEAEAVLTDARRILRASGEAPFALFAETQLARAVLARGRPRDAFDMLRKILQEAEQLEHAAASLEIAVNFASAATAAGEPELALAELERAAGRAGDEVALFAAPVNRVRGEALAALGRLDEAEACLERALAEARRQALLYHELLIIRERAALRSLRGTEPDLEELREAGRLAQLLGVPD